MKVRFYLNRSNIFLRVTPRPGDQVNFYIRESVPKSYWNAKMQRVRSSAPSEYSRINGLMDAMSEEVTKVVRERKMGGNVIRGKELIEILEDKFVRGVVDKQMSINDYAQIWLARKEGTKGHRFYKSKLKTWEKLYPEFDWGCVAGFWVKNAHMKLGKLYASSTAYKFFSVWRSVILDAIDDKVWNGVLPKKWMPKLVEVDHIYLPIDEVTKISAAVYSCDRVKNAMGLWMLMYYTGARYENLTDIIKPSNVIYLKGEKYVRYMQVKTNKYVSFPVNKPMEDLLMMGLRKVSNQKLNDYIKEGCNEAGVALWEEVTCHTARRSCVTNLVLMGMDLHLVMQISGHKTQKEFMKYVRYDDLVGAISMRANESFIEFSKVHMEVV